VSWDELGYAVLCRVVLSFAILRSDRLGSVILHWLSIRFNETEGEPDWLAWFSYDGLRYTELCCVMLRYVSTRCDRTRSDETFEGRQMKQRKRTVMWKKRGSKARAGGHTRGGRSRVRQKRNESLVGFGAYRPPPRDGCLGRFKLVEPGEMKT
jgi:hypothetical protein